MNRIKQIDVLRALAVLLVLGRHMEPCPANTNPYLYQFSSVWLQGGWIGVDLFFVLSGFLVSGLLFREYEKYGNLRIRQFLIRRGFKIYPPFWLLIGVTVMVRFVLRGTTDYYAVASELLFVQNYGPALWNHTWSLAVEEQFYFILAVGFFLLAKRQKSESFQFIPHAFFFIATVSLILRVYTIHSSPYDHKTHAFPTHLRLDGLFFGVLLSYWLHHYPVKFLLIAQKYKYLLGSTGILLLLPAFFFPLERTPFIFTYGITLFYLGSGALVVAAMGAKSPQIKLYGALAYIGSHSYSIYLWHMPIARWGEPYIKHLFPENYRWHLFSTFYLVASIVFGIGMAILIEFPVLRLRDRFFPSRSTQLRSANYGVATVL